MCRCSQIRLNRHKIKSISLINLTLYYRLQTTMTKTRNYWRRFHALWRTVGVSNNKYDSLLQFFETICSMHVHMIYQHVFVLLLYKYPTPSYSDTLVSCDKMQGNTLLWHKIMSFICKICKGPNPCVLVCNSHLCYKTIDGLFAHAYNLIQQN